MTDDELLARADAVIAWDCPSHEMEEWIWEARQTLPALVLALRKDNGRAMTPLVKETIDIGLEAVRLKNGRRNGENIDVICTRLCDQVARLASVVLCLAEIEDAPAAENAALRDRGAS